MLERDPRDRLQALRLASERIASNLLELEGDDTVAMLDASELRGSTAEHWNDARLRLAGLFAAHTALKDVIEQATRLVQRAWVVTADRLDELQALLTAPSIVVSDTTLRLPERGLLADSRRVVRRTPDELITEMSAEFDAVRSVVVRVCHVWDGVVQRLRCEREREVRLHRLADALGVGRPDLASAGSALRAVSELALCDPLAVEVARLDEVTATFDKIEDELADLRAAECDWPRHVSDARDLLARATRVSAACAEAVARANSRIALEHPLEPVSLPTDLVELLDTVIARRHSDRLSSAADLHTWRKQMVLCIADADAVTARCNALIEQRDELRARLDAYAAKADRLRLLESHQVVDAFERARACLYTAPTDLRVATELVGRYRTLVATGGET
jgi:hypothetical protein